MSERVPLSFLMAEHKAEHPPVEPMLDSDHPLPVFFNEELWNCTSVLERTVILASIGDRRDTRIARHDQVLVDPDQVQWRTVTAGYDGARLNSKPGEGLTINQRLKSPWRVTPAAPRPADAATVRKASDARAEKNKTEVAEAKERELEAARAQAVKHSADQASGFQPSSEVEKQEPTEPLPRIGTCAKCGQRGRLDDQGNCQRHQPRPKRENRAPVIKPPGVMPSRVPPRGDGSEEWHGTAKGYKNHDCRCDACTKAHRDEHRDYMERRREAEGEKPAHKTDPKVTPDEGGVPAIVPLKNEAAKPRKNGRPALTFKELLAELRQLSEYAAGLEKDNATLRSEVEQLRAEQASLYDELHGIVALIKQKTRKPKEKARV